MASPRDKPGDVMNDVPLTQYARLGSDRIAYQVFGDGPVDLLWVPASGDCFDLRWDWPGYAEVLHWLGTKARVISFDRRGTGAVDAPSGETLPSWELWADDVRVVLDAVGIERAVIRGNADRILTTVLFTDIVGSTQQAAALGDRRWRSVLDTHDKTVRDHLRRFRGNEINTTGDGFVASFDGPARAIRCAQAIVESTGTQGIQIRAGLHTGECEVRGDDLGGLAVHIAARVGASAAPREVLVSGTVKDLVVGSGIEFRERGGHDLRGVPGTWRLYAVEG